MLKEQWDKDQETLGLSYRELVLRLDVEITIKNSIAVPLGTLEGSNVVRLVI